MKASGSLLLAFALAALLPPCGLAQEGESLNLEPLSAWRNPRPGTPAPLPRAGAGMVFDDVRNLFVVHAGSTGPSSVSSDTWTYNGIVWQLQALGPQVWAHGMAFDSARGVTLLFGGFGPGSTLRGDTWVWNGGVWTDVTPAATNASPRASCAMAWDPVREVMVLQGGALDRFLNVTLNDTWEWDGASWHRIEGAGGPYRAAHRLVYDRKRQVMVLVGGLDRRGVAPVDTWEYADGQWRQVSTQGPPGGRENVLLYYDPDLELTIMHGGGEWALHGFPQTRYFTDTWAWDGQQWTELHPASPAREGVLAAASAYDPGRGQWVIFGGMTAIDTHPTLVDTLWEFGVLDGLQLRSAAMIDEDFTIRWDGGVAPFQVQARTSLLDGDWENLGVPTLQRTAVLTPDGESQCLRVIMEGLIPGTEVHVMWTAQPPLTSLPSGNLRAEGWERIWFCDAEDDRLDGYVTVTIDALFDPQMTLLEAGGDFTVREQLDSYTYDDFVNGTFDTNLVVRGDVAWEGRWTLYPPENTLAVAAQPTGSAVAYYFHQNPHSEVEHGVLWRIDDPGM